MKYTHPLLGPIVFTPLGGAGGPIKVISPDLPIVPVMVPQLRNVPLYDLGGKLFGGNIRWHKRGVGQLLGAWAEVEKQGLLPLVYTFDGALNQRLVRGSEVTPSNHFAGLAFDINAGWNGLGVNPPPVGRRGSVRLLAPIFNKFGFRWGGDYTGRKDGMHFEIVRWLDMSLPESEVGDEVPTASVLLNGIHLVVPAILRSEVIENKSQTVLYVGVRAWAKAMPGSALVSSTVLAGGKLKAVVSGPAGSINVEGIVLDDTGYVPAVKLYTLYPGLTRIYDADTRQLRITLPS